MNTLIADETEMFLPKMQQWQSRASFSLGRVLSNGCVHLPRQFRRNFGRDRSSLSAKIGVLTIHFVVLKRDLGELSSVFVTPDRLLEDEHVFRLHRRWWSQDFFHLCLAHASSDLVVIVAGQLRSGQEIAVARGQNQDRQKCYRDYFHRSHSPITKSKLPKIATTSLIMQPGSNSGRMLRLTNDGARILSRCGTPPPRLLM